MPYFVSRRVATVDLVPGMVLDKMVVSPDGTHFLAENTVLTLRVIHALTVWEVSDVEIREEVQRAAVPEPLTVMPEAQAAVVPVTPEPETEPEPADTTGSVPAPEEPANVPAAFAANYQAAIQILKMNLARVRFMKDQFEAGDIQHMVLDHVLPMIEEADVMDSLMIMPHSEDYLYHHSLDVGIIAGCLGLWLERPFREIEEIILGGLLHDVGKALIPLKILNKPDALNEEEMNLARFHSIRGYNFLKQNRDLSRSVLFCALQHHERLDGTGYPLSVQGDKIHPYAKMVAVADVFDAMTSQKGYGRKTTPYEAVEVLKQEMMTKMDVKTCAVFIEKLSQRFLGDIVQLSNGQRGEVVYLNQSDCTRPMVRTTDGEFIDLAKKTDLSITRLVQP